jgi:hypothetical protein
MPDPDLQVLESSLFVSKARLEHGGRYTCGPTLGISDNITVHIIAGERGIQWTMKIQWPEDLVDLDKQPGASLMFKLHLTSGS